MGREDEVQEGTGSNAAPVGPGDILAGKYRVDRVLGIGGMGVVVAATHVDLLEPRAIKFMLPAHLDDGESVARFLREARACAHLKGEHVARVHDVGKLENGAPYMVMEHLVGGDLGALIARRGALPAHEAARYVLEACEALAEAHAAGIVHRDLKPENLFLAEGPGGVPSIKVLDFGISMILQTDRELRMTKTSAIMGSPYYMSPEQTRSSRDVDTRTDIWSLGVILYQLVTGQLPFQGENLTEIITSVLFGELARPSAVVRGLPAGLDAVIVRCLERDVARRYPSVIELAEALAPFAPAGDRSVERVRQLLPRAAIHAEDSVSAGTVAGDPTAARSGAFPPATGPGPAGRGSRVAALGIAAGVALALGVGGGLFFLRAGHPTSSTPRESASVETAPAQSAASSAPTSTPSVVPAASAETLVTPPVVSAASSSAAGSPKPPPTRHSGTRPSSQPVAPPPTPPPAGDPFGSGRR
jgi:serine/threonine-protein kinase